MTDEADVICRNCYGQLLDTTEALVLENVAHVKDRATQEVERRQKHLDSLRNQLSASEARRQHLIARLIARFKQSDPLARLRSSIFRAMDELDCALHRVEASKTLPARLMAARARHRSRQIVREQQQEAKRQASLEAQRHRELRFEHVLSQLKAQRDSLLIRDADYKRGNALENFVRDDWVSAIHEAYSDQCFLCSSTTDLTLDHLWIPKNEGGNLVMLIRDGTLLVSNVLLLCRSCNSAKGETPVKKFFTFDQLDNLLTIQKGLSSKMMTDKRLIRIASRWYGVVVRPLGPSAD